ncbi:TIGR01548 family HAD-type hydrolase [Myxacorys almedinensis]|uniref:TIGR01548 family HAD-type hydrolase n=1 Tax=Myxacorys almedinensis A TaxID=2690445 RepID=A0A8J7YX90_9CYAN|nr:TIGR01548 family HAD-type hydrolase [Myxacorys almedinensis]NDJ16274.1 TIGR01548 family HAD-type hydrolase [Myxacorys almedinensis A]
MNRANAIVVFDIDGVIRDVGGSYRRALADTVEHFTNGCYRPSPQEIDALKSEGLWNNDWEASQELVYRYFEAQDTPRSAIALDYQELVAFFQSRYRGADPEHWTGYICQEPLLLEAQYFDGLTKAGIGWGFFSGATRASATYVLQKRLGLQNLVLVAMEDAPGKPDPTGLLQTIHQLDAQSPSIPVLYIGDTIADIYTVNNAAAMQTDRRWIGVGVLPPHIYAAKDQKDAYAEMLYGAGAIAVLDTVQALTPDKIAQLVTGE